MFYSFSFVLLLVSAVFFYRAGEFEGSSGVLWAALSVVISVLAWRVLKSGLLVMLLCQVGLFIGIGVVRAVRK